MKASDYAYEILKPRGAFTPGLFGDRPVERVLVLSGGGIDSFAAANLIHEFFDVAHFNFMNANYGQATAEAELAMTERQATFFESNTVTAVDVTAVDLSEAEKTIRGPLRADAREQVRGTANEAVNDDYVPFRNARFLTQAVAVAETFGLDTIVIGAVGGVNPDNSYQFLEAVHRLIAVGSKSSINLYAPFVLQTKAMVPLVIKKLDIVHKVATMTTSCFNNNEVTDRGVVQCGHCRSCTSLKQAFVFAGVEDPYRYEDHHG